MKIKKIILIILGILVLGNLIFLDWRIIDNREKEASFRPSASSDIESPGTSEGQAVKECSDECQMIIEEKVTEQIAKIPTQKPGQTVTYVVPTTAASQNKISSISYIPLASEGTINSADWKDLGASDFYFDLNDYPNARNVRFEIYLKSQYQAGRVSVRLYDVTNKRAVDYSDLSSSSESFELQRSSDLSIWRGNNLYRLQGRTQSGIEGYLKDAKLRVLF